MKKTKTSSIKIVEEEKREFSTGAKRQVASGKGLPVLCSPLADDLLAKHMEGGVEAGYTPRNWEKGILLSEIMNSILRHARQEREGLTDENHAIAMMWNAYIYIHTKEAIRRGLLPKELDDMVSYVPKQCPLHPKYKPTRKPRNKCDICWLIYENRGDKK